MALGNPSKPSGCSNHVLKQKLKREHHLKGALRNQSNKHQNSQKIMLKAEQKMPVATGIFLFCFQHWFFVLLSALASVNFDVCSIDFVMLLLNGVPFSIFVLIYFSKLFCRVKTGEVEVGCY